MAGFKVFHNSEVRKQTLTLTCENFDLQLSLQLDQCKVSVWSNQWMELHQIFSEWYKYDIKLFHGGFVRNIVLNWPNRMVTLENFHAWRRQPFYFDLNPKWRQECRLTILIDNNKQQLIEEHFEHFFNFGD